MATADSHAVGTFGCPAPYVVEYCHGDGVWLCLHLALHECHDGVEGHEVLGGHVVGVEGDVVLL